MSPTTNPVRTVLRARKLLAAHDEGNRALMRLLVDQLAGQRRLSPPDWPPLASPVPANHLEGVRTILAKLDMTEWDFNDIGTAYEHVLGLAGQWYTPLEIVHFMVNLSIGPQLDELARDPDPGSVLRVIAIDPSCGAGVFLVAAARLIAQRYAHRLFGEATPVTTAVLMPDVMSETIFGIDIDPVAVELAKAALWFELAGERPITFMDRNIICGDTLSGPHVEPPKLAERLARRGDSAGAASLPPR